MFMVKRFLMWNKITFFYLAMNVKMSDCVNGQTSETEEWKKGLKTEKTAVSKMSSLSLHTEYQSKGN